MTNIISLYNPNKYEDFIRLTQFALREIEKINALFDEAFKRAELGEDLDSNSSWDRLKPTQIV